MGDEGLRERKKRRTRRQIIEAAMRLFAERGYQGTTVADIAAEADIAPRTFFAYFPSKEAVVFHQVDEDVTSLARTLRERPAGESAVDALRRWIEGQFDRWDEDTGAEIALRKRLCRKGPSLAQFDRSVMSRFEVLLREAAAVDLGEPADGLRGHLRAGAHLVHRGLRGLGGARPARVDVDAAAGERGPDEDEREDGREPGESGGRAHAATAS